MAPDSAELGRAQFDTSRLRLLKVAALIRHSTRWIWVRLPAAFPYRNIFALLAGPMNAPPETLELVAEFA